MVNDLKAAITVVAVFLATWAVVWVVVEVVKALARFTFGG